MRVGIDLDGVCYDFSGSLRQFLVEHRGWQREQCPDAQRWEFYEDWGLALPDFLAEFTAGVDAGVVFTWGDPYPGTRETFDRFKAAGHTIHIITDRSVGAPGAAHAATAAWLDRHGLRYDSLTFTTDKTIVQTDCMVDDKLANYDALDRVGCWAYLLDRPWNQAPGRRVRVASLPEFADEVLAK